MSSLLRNMGTNALPRGSSTPSCFVIDTTISSEFTFRVGDFVISSTPPAFLVRIDTLKNELINHSGSVVPPTQAPSKATLRNRRRRANKRARVSALVSPIVTVTVPITAQPSKVALRNRRRRANRTARTPSPIVSPCSYPDPILPDEVSPLEPATLAFPQRSSPFWKKPNLWAISRKKANAKAHADNGNGTREAQPEIARDIEATLEINTRDDALLVQAVEELTIPSESVKINASTNELVYRRIRLAHFELAGSAPAGTVLFDADPFVGYYNSSLTHNSSMSTFRDVYFDLRITVTVQTLPSYAGLLHYYFNRFRGDDDLETSRFAFEHGVLDLSAKTSFETTITMELPYRVFNTVMTPFAALGVGEFVIFAATSVISPANVSQPASISVFAEPINVQPFNVINRTLNRLQTALRPYDSSVTYDITQRLPVSNSMAPNDIAQHYGFVARVPLVANHPLDTEISTIQLHPLFFANTPLAQVAQQYSWFQGSLKLRFSVNLSKFQNITLAIVFVPADAQFDPLTYESFAFEELMFDEKHEHEVEFRYSAGSNWLPTYVDDDGANRAAFGNVVILLKNSLISTAPYATDPSLLVEVAGGSDFKVSHPRDLSKRWTQPALLQALNNEVPHPLFAESTNLYSDATLPTFLTTVTLGEAPLQLAVAPNRSDGSVLGLLVNSHAAWEGSLEYIFVFVGEGSVEVRYDPLKRVRGPNFVERALNMPSTGYGTFMCSNVNPVNVVRVPFCAQYDYLPTRDTGFNRSLNGGNANGCLFLNGTGRLKVYRRIGSDFKVHFYNSFSTWPIATVEDTPLPTADPILDPVTNPAVNNFRLQAGIGSALGLDTKGLNAVVQEARTTFADVNEMLPELRSLLGKTSVVMDNGIRSSDAVCSLLSGPGELLKSLTSVLGSGIAGLRDFILGFHNKLVTVLEVVTPSYMWQFLKNSITETWESNELALLYAVALISGGMALEISNPWEITCVIAVMGLTIPAISGVVSKLAESLLHSFSASAVKEKSAKLEAASPYACAASLLVSVVSFFIPTAKGTALSITANFGKDIAGIYAGAKAMDEIIGNVVDLVIRLPGMEKLLGVSLEEASLLLAVDLETYVAEVKNLMVSDYYNLALDNERVRVQERLWETTRTLERMLPKLTKTNFFFNTSLRKLMDEQTKMYKHSQTFKGHAKERFAPFIFMLGGVTRVGKSVAAAALQEKLCSMMTWDRETAVYTRQNTDAYFSGLAQQKIFYIDDAHTNQNSDGAQSDMATIMAFGTNAPWAPPMAAVDDKGRCVTAPIGMFCSNILGAPSNPGIRNVEAYLARRHLVISMVWKPEAQGVHATDFSHAEFVLINPHDFNGTQTLDADFNVCQPNLAKRYNFAELWKLISTRFVSHMFKQRKLRAERKQAVADVEMPAETQLSVLRDMLDHFDDLDYVDFSEVQVASLQALTTGQRKGVYGNLPKYQSVIALFGEAAVRQAIGDIIYVPVADRFLWRGHHAANEELFHALMEIALRADIAVHPEDDFDSELIRVNQAIAIIASAEVAERECMILAFPSEWHDIVRAAVAKRDALAKQAETIDVVGGYGLTYWIERVSAAVPKWLKFLIVALGVGGVTFYAVRSVRKLFTAAPAPLPPVFEKPTFNVQYAKDTMPTVALPVKPPARQMVPVEYAKDTMPTVALPVKPPARQMVPVEYAKDTLPTVSLPVKPPARKVEPVEYAKDTLPAVALPVKPVFTIGAAPTLVGELVEPSYALDLDVTGMLGKAAYQTLPVAREEETNSVAHLQSAAEKIRAKELMTSRIGRIWRAGGEQVCFLLDDTTILLNKHFVTAAYPPIVDGSEIELVYQTKEGDYKKYLGLLYYRNFYPIPNSDKLLIVFDVPLLGVRDSWNLIATEKELGGLFPTTGMLVMRDKSYMIETQVFGQVKRRVKGQTTVSYINLDGSEGLANDTCIYIDGFSYMAATSEGDCGSVLVLTGGGNKVYGIHTANSRSGALEGLGLAQKVYLEELRAARANQTPVFEWTDSSYRAPEPVFDARDKALGCVLAKLQSAVIDVSPYGLDVVKITSLQEATRGSMRSAFKESPISRFFPDEPFRVPAILSPNDPRAPYPFDPRPSILGKYDRVIKPLESMRLALVVDHLSEQFRALHHPYRPTGFLSFQQAVDGVPGAPYFDSINMASSPGIPFSLRGYHRKASMFTVNGMYTNGMPIYSCVDSSVEEGFDTLISCGRRGERIPVLYQEFMKDELLKRSKVFEKPATRGIANPPIHLLLAMRAAFLPFISLLQYNRNTHDCQVGVNPMSAFEWSEIYYRLASNSDLIFDADYSLFDSTIHGETLDAVATICNNTMGGTFEEQYSRKTLMTYVYDRVSQVTNVQVHITQGMASGTPITAVGNSLVNMIYLRYAWLKLAPMEFASLDHFDRNVKAIVYGDDNVVSVKAKVKDWYNLRTIAAALVEYGIVMTDGQKNSGDAVKPFSTWADIRFLKRAFVLDPELGLYKAPLELKTILDRVRYTRSKAWTLDLACRVEISMRDAMFHGPEVFAALRFFLNDCMTEVGLEPVVLSYASEFSRWCSEGLGATMQMQRRITYARPTTVGTVDVFWAPDDRPPTNRQGQWVLPLEGPRPAAGTEGNFALRWQTISSTVDGATGGATIQQVIDALNARIPGPLALEATLLQRPTLEQIRAILPTTSTGGISLDQLNSALNTRLPGSLALESTSNLIVSLIQSVASQVNSIDRNTNGGATGGGITLAILQNELNQRLPAGLATEAVAGSNHNATLLAISALRREVDNLVARPPSGGAGGVLRTGLFCDGAWHGGASEGGWGNWALSMRGVCQTLIGSGMQVCWPCRRDLGAYWSIPTVFTGRWVNNELNRYYFCQLIIEKLASFSMSSHNRQSDFLGTPFDAEGDAVRPANWNRGIVNISGGTTWGYKRVTLKADTWTAIDASGVERSFGGCMLFHTAAMAWPGGVAIPYMTVF